MVSIAVDKLGIVYAWGDNTNKKLGIEEVKTANPVELIKVQDKAGNELPLKKMEIVATYKDHSCISDEEGSVYTVRTKHKWRIRNRRYKSSRYTSIGYKPWRKHLWHRSRVQ